MGVSIQVGNNSKLLHNIWYGVHDACTDRILEPFRNLAVCTAAAVVIRGAALVQYVLDGQKSNGLSGCTRSDKLAQQLDRKCPASATLHVKG